MYSVQFANLARVQGCFLDLSTLLRIRPLVSKHLYVTVHHQMTQSLSLVPM